jgi:hypothetical protein
MSNRLAAAALWASIGLGEVFGQATASTALEGTVTDQTRAVIPNAHVRIVNQASGNRRDLDTDRSGLYRFDLLPAGTYEVRFSAEGFSISVFQDVEVAVQSVRTFDVVLQLSTRPEEITVEAQREALLEPSKTDVSLPVTPRMVQEIPLNGRDFMNLALLAPGTKQVDSYDPTKNRIGVFAVNGSDGRNVNVTVNGVDNKDNTVGGTVMQLPLGAIEEFNINTQRFSAANGRSEGAAINVITKSGSNTPHGSLYFFDRNEALNKQNFFEQTKAPYSRQQFGGSIGGPLKKDRAFLFFALERAREQTNISVDPNSLAELQLLVPLGAKPVAAIPTPYFDWRYNGRLDYSFNSANSLALSYSNQNNRGENDQSGSQNDLTHGNFTTNQLILASATVTSLLSPRAVNSFTAGYQYWNNRIDSDQRLPSLTFPSGVTIGTNIFLPQQSYQQKWQFRDDFALTRGTHTLQTGVDLVWEPKLGGLFQFLPTPAINFLADPSEILGDKAAYPQGFATPGLVGAILATAGDPHYHLSAKMFGLYFQDDWKASRRLTVNLGIRWDRDFNLLGGSTQASNRTYLQLKAINSPYASRLPQDDRKDFSPRAGFAYDLTGAGRHVIRGGYGLYYGQVFLAVPVFMLQQANPTLFGVNLALFSSGPGDPNADPVPGTNLLLSQWRYGVDKFPVIPPPSVAFQGGEKGNVVHPDYRNPYTQQFNIGYGFQVDRNDLIEVEYVHTLGLHEPKTIDINPKDPANGGARPLDAPFAAKGLPPLSQIDVEMSIGRSRYDGLNISYRRRMNRRVNIESHYVLSRALAYNGSAASFLNYPTDMRQWFAAHDLGPTPADERHRWVMSAVIDLPWGLRLSPLLQIASARPYNSAQGIDVFDTGTDTTGAGQNNAHAILLKSRPGDYLATKDFSAEQLRACLAAGTCFEDSFDHLRGQPFFQFDARVSKTIRFRDRATLEIMAQAFDLTNRANFGSKYVGNVQSAQFGQAFAFITPSGVIVPRSFSAELGAVFRF